MEKKRQIRILHTGDIHLDSPFSRLSPEQSEERRGELRQTFSRLMALVREKEIDIVLIAGDLFDRAYVTAATADLLIEEFSACPGCRFFIAPGNHDPYTPGSLYASGRLPAHVHVFTEESLACVTLEELGVAVWGWAFTGERHEGMPLSGQTVTDRRLLNLVCGHCDFAVPLTRYAAVSAPDLAGFAAHYAAFAHRHIPTEPKKEGPCLWAYCGCLEGRSFDEPGRGGAYLVTATQGEDGAWCLAYERLTLSQRQYAVAEVDITGVSTKSEAAQRILYEIREKGYDENTALRVIFTGTTPPDFAVPQEADAKEWNLYHIELIDRTIPTFDDATLANDPTVRGALYRYLLPQLTTGTPKERSNAARALRMGLAALAGNDITKL